ncbi:hypothetical protein DMUE_4603 [Dictyocoela muelleri]|nr:hypothetical protein DMUE_4603 [Dictyocoela muelleri]
MSNLIYENKLKYDKISTQLDNKEIKNESPQITDTVKDEDKSLRITEYNLKIIKTIQDILLSLRIEDMKSWKHTPKISSLTIKKNILQLIDDSIVVIIQQNPIKSIDDIVKLLYAFQIFFYNVSHEKKIKSNWV